MKQVNKNPETPINQHLPEFNSTFLKRILYYINEIINFFCSIPSKFKNALSKDYKALFCSKLNIYNKQSQTKKNYSENTINETRKRAADEHKPQIVNNNNDVITFFMKDLHHKIAANDSAHTQENDQPDKTSEKDKISDVLDSIQETDHSGIDLKHDIFAALTPENQHSFISVLSKLEPPEQERLTREVAFIFAELTPEDQHDFISALRKLEPPEQERLTRDVAEMLSIIKQADINNGEEKEKRPDTPLHQLFRDENIEEINQKYPRLLKYAGYKNLQGQLPGDILKSRFVEIPSKLRVCNEDINQPRYSFHTPFHKLCRDGSIEEIKKKYPNYLKYATCKNLQGQLPGDILKSRFCRCITPYELEGCIKAIDKQMSSRYFNMKNNITSFFKDEGCTEELSNYFKDPKGLCYGLVYMRAQAFLDTSKDNTMPITQFDFIINLLSRNLYSFPLLVKNHNGEEVLCDSLFKVVNTLNDEFQLTLRAFLTELLSVQEPDKTLLSDVFPDTGFKLQDMLKFSEIHGKLDLFANTLFLGNDANLDDLFTPLFDELKKMPKNSFLHLDNFGHTVGVYYDPKSDKLVYFDQNNLQCINEQFAKPFNDASGLAKHVFTILKDKNEDVLFLKIKIYTRPKTLEDQKGIQETIQKLFEKKHKHMQEEYYEKQKDSTSMQKMIRVLLYIGKQNRNVKILIRNNNNKENRYLVLRSAIKHNNKELVQLLANEKDLLYRKNEKGETVLFDAIKTGNLETVEILLEAGANVDEIRLFGLSEIEQQRTKYLQKESLIRNVAFIFGKLTSEDQHDFISIFNKLESSELDSLTRYAGFIFSGLTHEDQHSFISALNKFEPSKQESLTREVALIFAELTREDQHSFISALNKLEPPEQERLTREVAFIFAELTPEDQHDFISALSKLEPPEQERLTRDVAEMLSTIKQADINNGEEKKNFPDTQLHQLFRDENIEEINQKYPRLLQYAGYKNLQGQLPGDILKHRFGEIPSELRACNEYIKQPRYSFHTPFHKLCRDGSIEEIKKKYPNYLKYATCKNLQGQLPGDILKSRFRYGTPYELKDCIEAIDEQIESRYFKMENNLISFFSDEGCTKEFLNYFKNVKGLCYGLVYMRAQAFLDTSKDNTMSITQFDFIMNLLFRDFSSFPLLVKNNSGEEVRCDSLFKVVNTLNDESRLPLRAFLTELLSAHKSNKTLISDAFPDTKFKSQDMLKISEIYGKLDLFANTLFLGNETNLHVLFTLLFDKLKKMPKNSFLQLSNVGHAVGVYYDPKSDKLVYFDHNNLHYKNEQLAETFDNTSRLAEHVFTTLKDESEDVLFLKITIYTRPKTLEDQKGIQEKIQKLFERKCGHMRKEHYEKEKDSTSMQKMIISLLRNQSSVNLHKKNVRRLIRDNNNRENRHLVLRSAIKQNNKELVQLLANERDLLDIQNKKGKTVLFDAIKTGNPETVKILLEAGANVDLINKSLIDKVRSLGLSEIEQLIAAKEGAKAT